LPMVRMFWLSLTGWPWRVVSVSRFTSSPCEAFKSLFSAKKETSSEIRYPYILHIIGKFILSGESYMMALYFISQFNKQGDGTGL
jgi:hypothetical protein